MILCVSHGCKSFFFFFFNDTATTEIYTLSLHYALPICSLITMTPKPGTGTCWFTSPLTVIVWPLIVRPAISELPETFALLPLHVALARAKRASAATD